MTTRNIEDASRVTASPHTASAATSGEAVILDAASSTYYGLDGVGQRVWDLVAEEPREVREIRDALLGEFDVAPEVLDEDLRGLLSELASAGLIDIETPPR